MKKRFKKVLSMLTVIAMLASCFAMAIAEEPTDATVDAAQESAAIVEEIPAQETATAEEAAASAEEATAPSQDAEVPSEEAAAPAENAEAAAPAEEAAAPVEGKVNPVPSYNNEETLAENQAADEQPADEQPADEQPADEQPTDEQPADDQPADEQPTDEQPADEQTADEQPADEQPADEQPADEQPADEQPADEQPADEQPADEVEEEYADDEEDDEDDSSDEDELIELDGWGILDPELVPEHVPDTNEIKFEGYQELKLNEKVSGTVDAENTGKILVQWGANKTFVLGLRASSNNVDIRINNKAVKFVPAAENNSLEFVANYELNVRAGKSYEIILTSNAPVNYTLTAVEGIQNETIDEINEEPIENITEEVTEEAAEETTEEVTEEAAEETTEEVTEEATEETTEEVTEEAAEETTEEVTEETAEETTEEVTEEAAEETTEETTEEVAEETTEETAEEAIEETTEEETEEATEETKETEAIVENTAEENAEEVAAAEEENVEEATTEEKIEGNDSEEEGIEVTKEEINKNPETTEEAVETVPPMVGWIKVDADEYVVGETATLTAESNVDLDNQVIWQTKTEESEWENVGYGNTLTVELTEDNANNSYSFRMADGSISDEIKLVVNEKKAETEDDESAEEKTDTDEMTFEENTDDYEGQTETEQNIEGIDNSNEDTVKYETVKVDLPVISTLDNRDVFYGEICELNANIDGLEDMDISFQWYYSLNGEEWIAVENYDDSHFSFVMDASNWYYRWKVIATISFEAFAE